MSKIKNARAKRAKILFFIVKLQICGVFVAVVVVYDATVAKTSLKIASSSFSIYSLIMSVCLTFESYRNNPGTEFRGAVSTLENKIQICARVFTFSVKLDKWSFHVADLPKT